MGAALPGRRGGGRTMAWLPPPSPPSRTFHGHAHVAERQLKQGPGPDTCQGAVALPFPAVPEPWTQRSLDGSKLQWLPCGRLLDTR